MSKKTYILAGEYEEMHKGSDIIKVRVLKMSSDFEAVFERHQEEVKSGNPDLMKLYIQEVDTAQGVFLVKSEDMR